MTPRRPLLLPLVPVYAGALRLKKMFGRRVRRLRDPVVSIGSLSAGGAGKTPVVAALAELLARHGWAVDVLSRGYGRSSSLTERVDPDGSATRFGDEPLLLARRGLAVYVAADRHAAGMLAEADTTGQRIHLLDDGFQHQRLARALDVVLLTAEDAADWLLPAGNLREPRRRLGAADAVVLREEEEAALRPLVEQRTHSATPLWIIRRRLTVESMPDAPLAFCGLARPEGFYAMLQANRLLFVGTKSFPDHHRYTDGDIALLLAEARRRGASGFVTTEKDAVKLSKAMRAGLESTGPLSIARLDVEFLNPDAMLARIAAAVGEPDGPA